MSWLQAWSNSVILLLSLVTAPMMHLLFLNPTSALLWELLVPTLPRTLLTLSLWTTTSAQSSLPLNTAATFLIQCASSSSSKSRLTSLQCLLFSPALWSFRTLHLTLSKCFGSTWSWIRLLLLLSLLSLQAKHFSTARPKDVRIRLWTPLCGETSLDKLSTRLLSFLFCCSAARAGSNLHTLRTAPLFSLKNIVTLTSKSNLAKQMVWVKKLSFTQLFSKHLCLCNYSTKSTHASLAT